MRRFIGVLMIALIIFSAILPIPKVDAYIKGNIIPILQIKQQPAAEYRETDTLSFIVSAPNYTGQVEYRLRINNKNTGETKEVWDNPSTGNYYVQLKLNGNSDFTARYPVKELKSGTYNITVFVRKAGTNVVFDSCIDTKYFTVKNEAQPAVDNTNSKILRVFTNFMGNTDYGMDIIEFLKLGPQTDSKRAREIAKQFNDKKDISTLEEIYKWIRINLDNNNEKNMDRYSSNVEEILERGFLNGSEDYALVFSSLLRIKGIPTVVVNSANIKWVLDFQKNPELTGEPKNYTFIEVYINKCWMLIDPQNGILYKDYNCKNMNLPGGYYALSKGIEIWDTGIKYESHNNAITRYLFSKFNTLSYKEPSYADTYYIGKSLDTERIKNHRVFIVPVCGDNEVLGDLYYYIPIPPSKFKRVNIIAPVISAQQLITNIKYGAIYDAVIISYVSNGSESGNKDCMPDELVEYIGVDRAVIEKESEKGVYRKLIIKDGIKYLIIAAPELELIKENIVMKCVDEIF